jgi:hypothetical protein
VIKGLSIVDHNSDSAPAGHAVDNFMHADAKQKFDAAVVNAGEQVLLLMATDGLGNLYGAGASGVGNAGRLVHLTDTAGLEGITSSGTIIGRHGIFALPECAAAENTAMKVFRTGLMPAQTTQAVRIPTAAEALFQRPLPIGPYSSWKYFGGVQYASPGSISTASGVFTPSSTFVGPNVLIYGPDALFYGGVGTAGALNWYSSSTGK